MYNYHNRKKFVWSIFLILLLFIGIGYAYLTSNLSIAGNTHVATNTWNIHFEDLNVTPGSVEATTPASINGSASAITYTADLSRPGDFYEFTVDVKNSGTLPGKVAIANISGITTEAEPIIDYSISYMNGAAITTNDILNEGATKTVKVRVFYKDGIDPDDFPDDDLNLTLTFTLQYVQSDHSLPTGTLYGHGGDTSAIYSRNQSKSTIESIEFLDYIDIPANAIASWDASEERNDSIKAWYLDEDNNGLYELYVGQEGGVIAPENCSWELGYFTKAHTINVAKLNVSNVKNMYRMFYITGYYLSGISSFEIKGLEKWDTSQVTSMEDMFWGTGDGSVLDSFKMNLSSFNTENVESMKSMFRDTGNKARVWEIGNLTNWNMEKVTTHEDMFYGSATLCEVATNIGTVNLYANNISNIFSNNPCISGIINIYTKPTSYAFVFREAATVTGAEITVNYTADVTNIDDIIATKGSTSNVVKGNLIQE